MVNSLPSCFGYFGAPLAPNGPCEKCEYSEDCLKFAQRFTPKEDEAKFLREVLTICEKALGGQV